MRVACLSKIRGVNLLGFVKKGIVDIKFKPTLIVIMVCVGIVMDQFYLVQLWG